MQALFKGNSSGLFLEYTRARDNLRANTFTLMWIDECENSVLFHELSFATRTRKMTCLMLHEILQFEHKWCNVAIAVSSTTDSKIVLKDHKHRATRL